MPLSLKPWFSLTSPVWLIPPSISFLLWRGYHSKWFQAKGHPWKPVKRTKGPLTVCAWGSLGKVGREGPSCQQGWERWTWLNCPQVQGHRGHMCGTQRLHLLLHFYCLSTNEINEGSETYCISTVSWLFHRRGNSGLERSSKGKGFKYRSWLSPLFLHLLTGAIPYSLKITGYIPVIN